MREELLYREIGLVDDDLIAEAEAAVRGGEVLKIAPYLASAAATAVILLGITAFPFVWQKSVPNPGEEYMSQSLTKGDHKGEAPGGDEISGAPEYKEEDTLRAELIFNAAQAVAADKENYSGYFWEEFKEEDKALIFPGASDIYSIDGKLHYMQDGKLIFADAHFKSENGEELYLRVSPDPISLDYVYSGQPEVSKIGDVDVKAGYCDESDRTVYYAEFELEDIFYYVETADIRGEAALTALVVSVIQGGKADFSQLSPVIPEYKQSRLTLEEACKDTEFGSYFINQIPKGFAEEVIWRFQNQEQDYLRGTWTKGLDYLNWSVSYLKESDKASITPAEDKENYDLSLYPFPLSESVPEQLREIVDHPIFQIEEVTPDVVRARTYTIEDRGDSKGERANFAVLCNGDILVQIRSKGLSRETIYDLVNKLAESAKGGADSQTKNVQDGGTGSQPGNPKGGGTGNQPKDAEDGGTETQQRNAETRAQDGTVGVCPVESNKGEIVGKIIECQ